MPMINIIKELTPRLQNIIRMKSFALQSIWVVINNQRILWSCEVKSTCLRRWRTNFVKNTVLMEKFKLLWQSKSKIILTKCWYRCSKINRQVSLKKTKKQMWMGCKTRRSWIRARTKMQWQVQRTPRRCSLWHWINLMKLTRLVECNKFKTSISHNTIQIIWNNFIRNSKIWIWLRKIIKAKMV